MSIPNPQGSLEGIPAAGRARLAAMRPGANQKGLFTSDLSVNEFLLVKEAGFEPMGLVVGSSIYHIGWQQPALTQSVELTVLTQAMYHARDLAMTRMEEEADAIGADGIVGVRLDVGRQEWGENLAEFIAIGTAIRSRDGSSHRTAAGKPFTSDLSGQDFWNLTKAGYSPVSFVMGNCVFHVGYQGVKQWFKQVGQNCEMPTYTQAIYDARELALSRMQAEAERQGADGIVGARINESSQGWGSHIIEYFAVGTSIVATRADHAIPAPSLVLSLSDQPSPGA
ncbi:MAG: heavy metal-binding domain-containing protein [Capsulimonadaceae bacterium]